MVIAGEWKMFDDYGDNEGPLWFLLSYQICTLLVA